jgi:hypothetical protein
MNPQVPKTFRTQTLNQTPKAVKTLNGNVHGYNFINPNAVDVYVKLYDLALGDVTVGTSTPKKTLMVPKTGSVLLEPKQDTYYHFDTAITIAATTGLADSDTGALSAYIHAEVEYN